MPPQRFALLHTYVCLSLRMYVPKSCVPNFAMLQVLHELWVFVIVLLNSIKGENLVCATPPTPLDGFCSYSHTVTNMT